MSQQGFFDESPNGPLTATKVKRRVFVYDNQRFEDPGAEYSTQDVLRFLAETYPELTTATWHSRTLPDGVEEITFVKVTGDKG